MQIQIKIIYREKISGGYYLREKTSENYGYNYK